MTKLIYLKNILFKLSSIWGVSLIYSDFRQLVVILSSSDMLIFYSREKFRFILWNTFHLISSKPDV